MKNRKNTFFAVVVIIAMLFMSTAPVANAQTTDTVSQIQKLLEQIKSLQDQIENLKKQQSSIQTELQNTLALTRELRRGMSGDDVARLQEILSTDPDIYPERLITGTYGPLTEKAVKKFQQKFGIEQVGNVGPKTLSQLNNLLTFGAGNSGKVPPGLLIAPGIAKKLGTTTPMPMLGQKLPPGIAKKLNWYTPTATPTTTPDTIAPTISDLSATSTASTSITVSWKTNENANSVLWYSTSTPVAPWSSSNTKVENSTLVTNHSLMANNLSASTTYYYLVSSKDSSGNNATSSEKSIITLGQ